MRKLVPTAMSRALLDAAPDAMLVIDRTGSIIHTNAKVRVLFGYTTEELRGRMIDSLIPERNRRAHPMHDEATACGAPRSESSATELYGVRKDGTRFPAETTLAPIEVDGERLVIVSVRDGTSRRRVQQKFQRLLEAAPDAMVITNRAGRVTLINAQAERLFGYARGELLGQPVEVLIPVRYRAAHTGHRRAYGAELRARPMGAGGRALFGRRKDGSEFPAEISLSPLETEEGVLVITAIRDVTEQRKAEQERARLAQAQEALRMRDEFLSIASHELRTPLSALQMQVEGILRLASSAAEGPVPERVARKAESIRRAALRLGVLIDQLLDLSRISGGRLTLERERVDLAALVRGVVAQFEDELAAAGCDVTVRADQPVVGRWDPVRVEQVVTNLLSNAMKYGGGKPIEIAAFAEGDRARIVVRDHGIGIAPEDQARIFERFERLLSGRHYGGFGLGLWIARQMVEAHGGAIHVWSKPGAGSTFTVELPRDAEQNSRPSRAVQPAAVRPLVLLVDDDAMLRDTYADAIQEAGFDVKTAGSGVEALDLLRAGERPRVILLDLMMPRMDGATFRAVQRKDPALANIPVVLTSAASNAEAEAELLGAVACLKKPILLDDLVATLERYAR